VWETVEDKADKARIIKVEKGKEEKKKNKEKKSLGN